MNAKEAIKFLAYEIKFYPHKAKSLPACLEIYKIVEKIEEIIKVLEHGEKYEQMWGELIYGLAHINIGSYQNSYDKKMTDLECVNKIVENIKQKYFPKPKNRRQKINDLLEQLNSPGIQTDVKSLKNLLIELRDEEL